MRHYDYSDMKSVPLSAETLGKYDAVLIATDHSSYDYAPSWMPRSSSLTRATPPAG